MSSSKIQSYNLDDSVFDGIAMQSTSEEILSKVEGVNRSVESVGRRGEIYSVVPMSTGNMTILDVTGKGKLYYAFIYAFANNNKTCKVDVVVDGNLIVTRSASATSQTNNSVNLCNKDYTFSTGYYFRGGTVSANAPVNMNNADSCVSVNENSNITIDSAEFSTYPVDGYIQFNERLLITANNNYNVGGASYFCYSLDED